MSGFTISSNVQLPGISFSGLLKIILLSSVDLLHRLAVTLGKSIKSISEWLMPKTRYAHMNNLFWFKKVNVSSLVGNIRFKIKSICKILMFFKKNGQRNFYSILYVPWNWSYIHFCLSDFDVVPVDTCMSIMTDVSFIYEFMTWNFTNPIDSERRNGTYRYRHRFYGSKPRLSTKQRRGTSTFLRLYRRV